MRIEARRTRRKRRAKKYACEYSHDSSEFSNASVNTRLDCFPKKARRKKEGGDSNKGEPTRRIHLIEVVEIYCSNGS